MNQSTTSVPPKKSTKHPTSIDAVQLAWAMEQVLLLAQDSKKRFNCPITWNHAVYYTRGKDIGVRIIKRAVDALAAAGLVTLCVDMNGSLRISAADKGAA